MNPVQSFLIGLSLIAIGGAAVAADKPGAVSAEFPASGVIGAKVVGPRGESLGTIADLVFHSQTGTVRYVAVRHDGVLGSGDEIATISEWQLASAGPGRFVSRVGEESLERLPSFERVRWPAMRASQLIGREVRDRHHRDTGEIVDLSIDFATGRVSEAVVELRDDLAPGSLRLGLPIEVFSLPRDLGDHVVLNVERDALGVR